MHDFQDPANIYLENNVFTASPQRLRLMLIEAALRFAQQTIEHWQAGETDAGTQSLVRTQAIVSELQGAVRAGESDLAAQVAAMYLVLYRSLIEAQLENDVARVQKVVEALTEDRETWRLLCEKVEEEAVPHQAAAPLLPSDFGDLSGLSIEA